MLNQTQQELLTLRRILDQEDAILFVGSGISGWSGLPSWPNLISELVEFIEEQGISAELVRREAARNDLILAASYGFDLLTKPQTAEFIRQVSRLGSAQPHEIHRRIVTLGPRCYITTNYDCLLEAGLRLWQPDRFFRTVTNRHVTETADIIQARSLDFVFKPHGDAGDIDSIVLTREQYRLLLGERGQVLDALKTLLASRPIVYLGFGLRDPDFIYLKDLLAITYRGGARDHYAIMADVMDEEKPYWRKNYGIHLISYSTLEGPDGTKNHSALLTLLDSLIELPQSLRGAIVDKPFVISATSPKPPVGETEIDAGQILALARYTGHLVAVPKVDVEIPLRVTFFRLEDNRWVTDAAFPDQYDHFLVNRFLDSGPQGALLTGLPGAGKTYAFKQCASKMAQRLRNACLMKPFDYRNVVIPFYLDLKLYTGNLLEMAEKRLPPGLSIDFLYTYFDLKFFIDSFNEMPREYLESNAYEKDFSTFLQRLGHAKVIFGSRTDEGLQKLGLPTYQLDEIDKDFIQNEIEKHKLTIEGRFRQEIISLLQKPFIFQLFISGVVDLNKAPHPRMIYYSYFEQLSQDFYNHFGKKIDLQAALAPIAYEAIDDGHETITLSQVQAQLKTHLTPDNGSALDETDVVNWLIAKTFLIPHAASRLTFFHQSVTEYLAAFELARLYRADRAILGQKLKFTRWDQALFLALSFLSSAEAKTFVSEVMKVDFKLSIRASKYLETDRDALVTEILSILVKKEFAGWMETLEYSWTIESQLPVSEIHIDLLRTLANRGQSLGGAAASLLLEIKGVAAKNELIDQIFSRPDDYNFCSAIGRKLSTYIEVNDIPTIAERVSEVPDDDDTDKWDGLISGLAAALSKCSIEAVKSIFMASEKNNLLIEIFCNILKEVKSPESLKIAVELLSDGVESAIFPIYMILVRNWDNRTSLPLDILTDTHIDKFISVMYGGNEENKRWAIAALRNICALRPDLVEKIRQHIVHANGVYKLALLSCIGESNDKTVWQGLSELTKLNAEELAKQPLRLLREIAARNWKGNENLLVALLKKRDLSLAYNLLEALLLLYSPDIFQERKQSLQLDIGPIHWWLDWIKEEQSTENGFWLCDRLGILFSWAIPSEIQRLFIEEFNRKDTPYRAVLTRWVFPRIPRITTDDFNEDAISFLLADLTRKKSATDDIRGHLLGLTATDAFVKARILPLLSTAKEPFYSNLIAVLKMAGERHGRRYVPDGD
jgi:hypothetical protein